MNLKKTTESPRHRVAILGASVSAQTVNHQNGDVVGYAEVLRRNYLDVLGASEITQFCYPGNRVSDGGLIKVRELIASGADICIFEPLIEELERGVYASRDEVLWVYRELLKARIFIVVFFIAHPQKPKPECFEQYPLHREICDSLGIPTVEINLDGMSDLDTLYRGVHTWLPGAEMYARRIVDKWQHLDLSPEGRDRYFSRLQLPVTPVRVSSTQYLETGDITSLRIRGRNDKNAQTGCYLRVIQPQWIGCFSPVLDVSISVWNGQSWGRTIEKVSVWDPYCHYDRLSYVVLFDGRLDNCIEYVIDIRVSREEPAYHTVRAQVDSWPDEAQRVMKPRGDIFWISDVALDLYVSAPEGLPGLGESSARVSRLSSQSATGIAFEMVVDELNSASPQRAPAASCKTDLQLANDLLRDGKYSEAIAVYERVQQQSPFSATIAFNIVLAKKRAVSTQSVPVMSNGGKDDVLAARLSQLTPDGHGQLTISDWMSMSLRWRLGAQLPLLSIVIPCYNSGVLLRETIRQVMMCRSVPFEIIVVDDGSTDGSFDVLQELAHHYPNLRVMNQENAGAGSARNRAIPEIHGLYTYFLDADDSVDMAEISNAVLAAMEHDYDLVFLPYRILYEESGTYDRMYPADFKSFRKSRTAKSQPELQRLAFELTGFPWNRIVLTELLTSEGIRFCDTLVHNDMLFHWQSVSVSKRMSYWNSVVCTHRKFASGSLSSNRGRRRLAVFDAMSITYNALKDNAVYKNNIDIWNRISQQTLNWNRSIISGDVVTEFDTALTAFKKKHIIDAANELPAIPVCQLRRRVSVVTITWNILGNEPLERRRNAAHFKQMLQSVQAQSYGRDAIEHVVIDGASTDGTKELVMDCLRDGQIDKLISEPDTGVYNAMNKGVRNSIGEYVVFLNAHDHLSPHGIEALVDALAQSGADYSFGNSITIDENNNPTGRHKGNINRVYLGMPFCHQAAMFARRVFDKVMFPESLEITTWGYVVELYLAGFRHAYCDEIIASFRSGGLSTSGDTEQRYAKELEQLKIMIATKVLNLPINEYENIRIAIQFDLHDSQVKSKLLRDMFALMQNMNPLQKDFFAKCIAMLRLDAREITG